MSCKYIYFHFPTKFEYELCKRIAEMTKPKSTEGQENCNENKLKEVLKKKDTHKYCFLSFFNKKKKPCYTVLCYTIYAGEINANTINNGLDN